MQVKGVDRQMPSTVTDEISAINEALAERIGAQKHRVWFKNSTRFTITEEFVKIGVPNHFIGSWIENHFIDDINEIVKQVTGAAKREKLDRIREAFVCLYQCLKKRAFG